MQILITGGTGFIGTHLSQKLLSEHHQLTVLTRDKIKVKSPITGVESLDELSADAKIDVIINLAGATINKRWTKAYKRVLLDSRIQTTNKVITLIERLIQKPSLLISVSAIGYYGASDERPLDESAKPNDGFTHQLCAAWEACAKQASQMGVRVCIPRLGVVLDKRGGALKEMLIPFKLGLGARLGKGTQYFSWVQLVDVIQAFEFFMQHPETQGIYNLTAPNAVTNTEFTKALGKALNRPTSVMPACMIKLLFGEMGENLLLTGSRVIPKRLQEAGFKFNTETIKDALLSK